MKVDITAVLVAFALLLTASFTQAAPLPVVRAVEWSLPQGHGGLFGKGPDEMQLNLAPRSLEQNIEVLLEPRGKILSLSKIDELLQGNSMDAAVKSIDSSSTGFKLDKTDDLPLSLWLQRQKQPRSEASATQLSKQLTADAMRTTRSKKQLEPLSELEFPPRTRKKQRASANAAEEPVTPPLLTEHPPESTSPSSSLASAGTGRPLRKVREHVVPEASPEVNSQAEERRPLLPKLYLTKQKRHWMRQLGEDGVLLGHFSARQLKKARVLHNGHNAGRKIADVKGLTLEQREERKQHREGVRRWRAKQKAEAEAAKLGQNLEEQHFASLQLLSNFGKRTTRSATASNVNLQREQRQKVTENAATDTDGLVAATTSSRPSKQQPLIEQAADLQLDGKALQTSPATSSAPKPASQWSTSFKRPRTVRQRYPEKKARSSSPSSDAIVPVTPKVGQQMTGKSNIETTEAKSQSMMPATNSRGFATVALMAPKPRPIKRYNFDAEA